MNQYNPDIHHRRSIRLKGYDYAQAGLYFVTICCENRICRFGNIENGEMILNDAGKMVTHWYNELEKKFPDIKCDEMIVMPNHFHCIVENVGADLRVCPIIPITHGDINKTHGDINKTHGDINETHCDINETHGDINIANYRAANGMVEGEHVGSPLHRVVQWFKTMTTNEYIRGVKNLGWQPFNGKLWQRNYYEHIIRDEKSYHNISNYIKNNPAKWVGDKFYV